MSEEYQIWEDPIVAEVRAVREAHAKRFDYDLDRIAEDLRAKRQRWEAMGVQFIDSLERTWQTRSLSKDQNINVTNILNKKTKVSKV